ADAEFFGGARLVDDVRAKGVCNLATLDQAHGAFGRLGERAGSVEVCARFVNARAGACEAEVCGRERGRVCEYAGALDCVLKLADVVGPRVRREGRDRAVAQRRIALAELLAESSG